MWKNLFTVGGLLAVCLFFAACGSNKTEQHKTVSAVEAGFDTVTGAIKLDESGKAQKCATPTYDVTCSAIGSTGREACDPSDGMCHLYINDSNCTYSENPGEPASCSFVPCANVDECDDGDSNNVDACVYTVQSAKQGYGLCMHYYKKCTAAAGTPCEVTDIQTCDANSQCKCLAVANMDKKQTEVCDGKDNNCDGDTDEEFTVGQACDGADSDKCTNGKFTCKKDQLGVECVNENLMDIPETCNAIDDDCDGKVDQSFADLGQACDGADNDKCANGTFQCLGDGSKTICVEDAGKNQVEVCDGKDNTCDGQTDEGCDDDGDKFCDVAMKVAKGAGCALSNPPTDTSVVDGNDCSDSDKMVNPGATDLCNSGDDNCNGKTDEDSEFGKSCSAGLGVCKKDGTFDSCNLDGTAKCSAVAGDPQTEICNNLDDNCDGQTDEGCDDDGDKFCDVAMKVAKGAACSKSMIPSDSSQVSGDDCDDANKDVNGAATEICDGVDNQCDGKVDEGCDDDGDKFCDVAMKVAKGAACSKSMIPSDSSQVSGDDCADTDAATNPGAAEICDTGDNNCDGKTDVMSDGKSACDSFGNSITVQCGNTYTYNMVNDNPNGTNAVENYTCLIKPSSQMTVAKTGLKGQEIVFAPALPNSAKNFSVQIMSSGVFGFLIRGGSTAIDAEKMSIGVFDGKTGCAGYGFATTTKNGSLSGGVAGDVFSFDSTLNMSVKFKVICQ